MNRGIPSAVLFFCALSANAQQDPAESKKRSPGLDAFADICLASAADFTSAAEKAAAYGIELMDVGSMKVGTTQDQSLAAQIKVNSCTVTTPSQRNSKLEEEFRALVAEFTGSTVATAVPFKVQIGGRNFVVMHDRRDGEAFVLLGS